MAGRGAEERLAVLAPEREKGVEQAVRVEAAALGEPRGLDLGQGSADGERELAGDDLAVDGVGDVEAAVSGHAHEAEVDGETEVVRGHAGQRGAREHRLDGGADARLAQPLDQAVEVGVLPLDEDLLGAIDVRGRDGLGAILDEDVDELAGERVGEPGLALGELEGSIQGFGLKALARPPPTTRPGRRRAASPATTSRRGGHTSQRAENARLLRVDVSWDTVRCRRRAAAPRARRRRRPLQAA
ncbi:hypothetical protein [Sorangium sp. So ce1097]|uniref:hypothetical protein n=1 Tax=Sorangium sp. So ce1097 TaxID=3133330 RepID=UPI003F5F72A6